MLITSNFSRRVFLETDLIAMFERNFIIIKDNKIASLLNVGGYDYFAKIIKFLMYPSSS